MNSLINGVTLTGVINSSSELVGTIQSTHFLCGTINSMPTITGTISGGRVGNLQGVIQSNGTITGKIAIGGVIGAIIGSKLLKKINDKWLKLIFIFFLIYSIFNLLK